SPERQENLPSPLVAVPGNNGPNTCTAPANGPNTCTAPNYTPVDPALTTCDSSNECQTSVSRVVPLIPQPDKADCWAAAATMMVDWKQGSSYDTNHDIDSVMKMAGPKYEQIYNYDQKNPDGPDSGLPLNDWPAFYSALGLVAEPHCTL